jgi:hypothetical protein
MVVTTAIQASTGMRFRATCPVFFYGELQPTQPARRAVDEIGFPSSLPPSLRFDATSRLMTNYLAAP